MKNTFKFKAIFKIAGIIALIAIIGFTMTACGDGGGGGGDAWALLDETTWVKGEGTDQIMLKFYSFSSAPNRWFFYGPMFGGEGTASSITSVTSNRVTTSSGPSFNFEISGDTIIITSWSIASEAAAWNGTYTKLQDN
jgi:hypothetical protein